MSLTVHEYKNGNHRYKIDGKWVPGVTTLINGGLPKDALKYWSARKVAEWVADHHDEVERLRAIGRAPLIGALKEIPFEERDVAAVRGRDVHALAEKLMSDEAPEIPTHLASYVDSCIDYLDTFRPEAIVSERPLGHRAHWWAGRPDAFVTFPPGVIREFPKGCTALTDYKTTASGIWAETAFQMAAYSHAEFYVDEDGEEKPIPQVDACYAIWLRADGYDVIPVRADQQVYTEFRHIAYVAKAAKRAKGNKSEPGYVGVPLDPPQLEEAS